MPLSPTATRDLLARLGLRPSRRLGQNFLVDGNIVRKSLALAEVRPGDGVIEVGPGLGTLTSALLEAGAEVWAIERDRTLHDHLAETLQARFPAALHLMEGDAVEHPLAGYEGVRSQDLKSSDLRSWDLTPSIKIVANLPYAIATPWLDAVLSGPLPVRLVLMLQQEAADRYAAEPGSKSFGAISIFLQAAYAVAPGHKVAASCFHPQPDIESRLLHLVRRPEPFVFSPAARLLIRSCFQQRRKQLGALLRDRLPDGGAAWLEHIGTAGYSAQARPEDIPVALWVRLATLASS
jgi:16S rRNA (adenine1518-N6/adenine1519-N6)-dimethyltransferase